jgi:hypothetical protein
VNQNGENLKSKSCQGCPLVKLMMSPQGQGQSSKQRYPTLCLINPCCKAVSCNSQCAHRSLHSCISRKEHVMAVTSVLRLHTLASNPIRGLDSPRGFQDVEAPRFQDNRHMKMVRLSALRTGRLYPPGNILGTHFC